MKTISYVKGASAILIAAVMLLSAVTVTATDPLTTVSPRHSGTGTSLRGAVWDNDLGYDALYAAQQEPTYGELGTIADDFVLDAATDINNVRWVGGYWNGPPDDGDFDWTIAFYSDASGLPGSIIAGPYTFPNAIVNETWIDGASGASNFYEYNVTLPETFQAEAAVTYWISWQGQGVFPPQSGMGAHATPIKGNELAFKSAYFGYTTWVPATTVWYAPSDAAFQLFAEGGAPPTTPDLEIGAITGGKSVSAVVQNIGDGAAENVSWTIGLEGGLILKGKSVTGTIATIDPAAQADITTGTVFGIGKVTITVTATCAEDTATKTASGFVFIIFVLGVA